MKKFTTLITHYPKIVIFINLLVIALLSLPIYRIHINPDLQALIPADDPDVIRMEELEEEFGGLDVILISYHADDVFAGDGLEMIDRLTYDLEALPQIDHIISLTNYESITSDAETMTVDKFIQNIPSTAAESDSLATSTLADPMLGRLLVSENREYTAIIVYSDPAADEVSTVDTLQAVLLPYQKENYDLRLGGMPVIRAQISDDIGHDTGTFIPAGMVLIAFLLYFSFRSRRGVLLPLLVVVLSITGTLGLMAWFGLMLSVISSIMPIMLIAVASAYGIHIITRYFEDCAELPAEASSKEVVTSVIEHMMRPLFLAGLTTVNRVFIAAFSHFTSISRSGCTYRLRCNTGFWTFNYIYSGCTGPHRKTKPGKTG